MSEFTDLLRQLVTMGAKFDALVGQVNRIEERQIQLLQRLSVLEERSNTITESARSAAQAGVSDLRAQVVERITRLEMSASRTERAFPEAPPDARGA